MWDEEAWGEASCCMVGRVEAGWRKGWYGRGRRRRRMGEKDSGGESE